MRITRNFINEEGSTSLAVVISILVACALLASCIQWYWVESSSNTIQIIADTSAIASMDVVAQSVAIIQLLDTIILTANLFGLVLNATVIVSGILAVFGGPLSSVVSSTFLANVSNFNKQYAESRKTLISSIHTFARGVTEATPLMAYVQAQSIAKSNSNLSQRFSLRTYTVAIIPFPLRGTLDAQEVSTKDGTLADYAEDTSEKNKSDMDAIKLLEQKLEEAIDICFMRDTYKPFPSVRAYWEPTKAITDYINEWNRLCSLSPNSAYSLIPIEDNETNRERISRKYIESCQQLESDLGAVVTAKVGATTDHGKKLAPEDINVDGQLEVPLSKSYFLLEHAVGERRAYHTNQYCSGLANASATLRPITLRDIWGDGDHPPCLLCNPFHWGAISYWKSMLGPYGASWNREASEIRNYQSVKDALEQATGKVAYRTRNAMSVLLSNASTYLSGGRMSYVPAGARGILCVASSSDRVKVPKYAMPGLTRTSDVELGPQIAVAGAKLVELRDEQSTGSDHFSSIREIGTSATGISAVLAKLLGVSDEQSSAISQLWAGVLDSISGQREIVSDLFGNLPWGLDSIVGRTVDELIDMAGASPPDMRTVGSALVNTGSIGDGTRSGFEGTLVGALRGSKSALESTGGASTYGIKAALLESSNDVLDQLYNQAKNLITPTIWGIEVPLPFHNELLSEASELKQRMYDAIVEAVSICPSVSL